MDDIDIFKSWFKENNTQDIEVFVPDMAGIARGKVIPTQKFCKAEIKMAESVFGQTISGNYIEDENNPEDRDMILKPDVSTLHPVPWLKEPTASVICDCLTKDNKPVETSPRRILRNILKLYTEKGWKPIVAPEVEFYLIRPHSDFNAEVAPPKGRLGRTDTTKQPLSIDAMNDFDPFINDVYAFCEKQDIHIDTLSQEMGPSQFEINFLHDDPISLADQIFLFKRTVREVAILHELHATFLARPISKEAGSALHIHQSVFDNKGKNIFSQSDGSSSKFFMHYIGGLQKYLPEALLIFAPYPNSYRRFLSYYCSPVNLEWAIDNRTVGLRVPTSDPENRRIENRIAGSDVNPYLALAATLACGYLGIIEKIDPRNPIEGSAYELPFDLHRHVHASIEAFHLSKAMREVLGNEFVDLYTDLKENEYREFQERITPWEREVLMLNV